MSIPSAHNSALPGIQLTATRNGINPIASPHVVINISATPSHRFLENNNRDAFLDKCVGLNKYALKGNWEAAEKILVVDPELLNCSITRGGDTVLHVAAGARQAHFVRKLVEIMDGPDLALEDMLGNTAFSIAAAAGDIEIAEIMRKKNKFLPTIRGGEGMTPLYMAALLGQSEMANYLYSKTKEMLEESDRQSLFFTCIDSNLYDLATELLISDKTLAKVRNAKEETALHILVRTPTETSQSLGILSSFIPGWNLSHNPEQDQVDDALQLVRHLWSEIVRSDHEEMLGLIEHPTKLLFNATKLGNYDFLAVLINSFPDLIWHVDEENRTIIHVAVLHRHADIFTLVHEIGSIKDIIVTFIDEEEGGNILHMAAKLAPPNQLNLVSGAALQMQRELVWFEEVKKIVHPSFIRMKNKNGETPQEVFTREHENLLNKGEAWMKHTANSCMIVAALIATVVFSAAFSVPGGTSNDTGAPNFLKETAFLFFAIADGAALVSSSTSILMFLFILTSRYTEGDFLKSLPLKLMIGLTSLFISIASMMVAFSTTFYLEFHYGLGWVPNLIFVFAFVPVALFVFLQFPLLSDMFSSTYCSTLLFQPWKHMIN